MKRIFITGGTGFFGKALLRYWVEEKPVEFENTSFTFLSRNPEKFYTENSLLLKNLDIKILKGDVQYPETLPKEKFTHIVHAATDSTNGLLLDPVNRFNQIVEGTRNILNLALESENPHFLLISSGGVYGPQPKDMPTIPETYIGKLDPNNPHNAYSLGKLFSEHLATLYYDKFGLEVTTARCFSFVGVDLPLNVHFAIGNFIYDALQGRDIVIKGDGKPVRSYLDQRDLACWLSKLLIYAKTHDVYNVGSNEEISIKDLANLIVNLSGKDTKVHILGHTTVSQSSDRNIYVPDISKIKKEFNLSIEYNLEKAISKTLNQLLSKID